MTDPVRARLSELMKERGETSKSISLLLGHDQPISQFLNRGTPKRLREEDRRTLAVFFGVDERELGAQDPWGPAKPRC